METKETRSHLNKSLSAFIISAVFIVVGVCFIPLTFVSLGSGKVFNPGGIDAIFMYIIFACGLGFLIYGIVYLVFYFKAKKKIK